jgi:hypothetical protein
VVGLTARRQHAFAAGLTAALAAASVAVTWTHRGDIHPDWRIARRAGRSLLFGDHLAVYASNPRAQMGPLALLVALVPRTAYYLLVAALLAVPVWCIARHWAPAPAGLRGRLLLVGCCAATVVPWTQLAWKGHADDALVLAGGVVALTALRRGDRPTAVCGYAVAVAGKPTAIVLAPVLAVSPGLLVALGAVTVAVWAPFVLASPTGAAQASRGVMDVGRGSAAELLGWPAGAPIPGWVRPLQLVAGLAAAALGRLRDRPWEGLVLAFTLRAVLETNPAPAYSIPLVLLSVVPDLRRGSPLMTATALATWWLSQGVLNGDPGYARMALLLLLAAVAGYDVARSR